MVLGTLAPRVDMLSLLRHTRRMLVAVTSSVEDPSTGTPQTSRLPPVKSTEVLSTELTSHWIPEANPPFQASLASWEPIIPTSSNELEPHDQPIIGETLVNGATQETVQVSDIDQLCEM